MTQTDKKHFDKESEYAYGHCRFIVVQNNAEKTYVAGKRGLNRDTNLEIAELPAGDYLVSQVQSLPSLHVVFSELDYA